MSNQIASMFASLGFKVDTTGLDTFNSKLREVRGNTVVASRNIGARSNPGIFIFFINFWR